MSRYQLGDQVYAIELVGAKITIIEPDGTQHAEELVNPELARTRLRVLTNQKLRGGWKVVREEAPPSPPPSPIVENARNPALEAALLADPEHVPSWLVYGDWLQQQGDPRGTYIALRAAARAAPDDLLAADRVRKLGNQHATYLHGGFGGVLGWGFLDEVRVTSTAELDVFAAPSGRFLTKLGIDHTPTRRLADIIDALGRQEATTTLRELSVVGEALLATLEPIEAILARLHVLDLHCSVAPSCLEQLARTPMPRLTRLGLRNREAGTREALVALLGRDLPSLTALHLDEQTGAPLIYEALAASPIARQLETLVLISIEEDDVEALAGRLDAFPKLTHLELPLELLDLPRSLLSELEARIDHVAPLRSRYVPTSE